MNSVITEITDNKGGIIFYDAECRFCTTWARRGERWLEKCGFRFAPLPPAADEMGLLTADGETIGGAQAMVYLARRVWWAWPLWAMSRIPGVMRFLESGYRWFAARRYCLNGACEIASKPAERTSDWLPGGCGLGFALAMGGRLPAWAWMWSVAVALFFGFKWITWIRARGGGLLLLRARRLAKGPTVCHRPRFVDRIVLRDGSDLLVADHLARVHRHRRPLMKAKFLNVVIKTLCRLLG